MFKKIIVILLALVAVFAVVIAMQPSDFRITRQLRIEAPAGDIFDQVNNLQNWTSWSPWQALDPNQKVTFEGPKEGVGAIMKWSGNSEVGQGTMTVTESKPKELVAFKLDFERPFAASHMSEFTFKPEGNDATSVTWSMYGKKDFIGKALSLVMNCEKMVGEQFDKGLVNLQNTLVKPAAGNAPDINSAPADGL